MPFVLAYNKKHASPLVPTPLDAAALCSVMIDDQPAANIAAAAPGGGGGEGGGEGGEGGGGSAGAPPSFSDILRKPACMLLPPHTKRVDLVFGRSPSSARGGGGGSGGGACGNSAVTAVGGSAASGGVAATYTPLSAYDVAERLKALWPRVRTTAEALAASREALWTNFRLSPADGYAVGAALLGSAKIRCEGSWDTESLGNLLTLSLQDNDLRCDGLIAIVDSGALHRDVICSLRDLFLQVSSLHAPSE